MLRMGEREVRALEAERSSSWFSRKISVVEDPFRKITEEFLERVWLIKN
jgi:hypothetical protein